MRKKTSTLLVFGLLGVAACCASPEPRRNATLVLTVPGTRAVAPSSGILTITAERAGLPDLRLEVPVAEKAELAGVAAATRFLLPKVWADQVSVAGTNVNFGSVDTAGADPGSTGIHAEFTFTTGSRDR